jgi:hypothetical protein
MNAMTIVLLILTATALTALTWWGCTWWYGRKLAELQGRLEKTRQTAAQSTAQTRRQIAQLQKELAERPAAPQRKVRDEAAEAAQALHGTRRQLHLVAPAELEQPLGAHRRLEVDVQLDLRVGRAHGLMLPQGAGHRCGTQARGH